MRELGFIRSALEELARRVVGQHLAAGLARRAVVHGVARVLDRPHGVAAHRARLAGAVVDPARTVLGRAHVVTGALVLQSLGDGLADGGRRPSPRRPAPACRSSRTGERRARWQTSLASRRPSRRRTAGRAGSRAGASTWPGSARQLVRLDLVGLGTELVEGRRAEHVVARHAPDAGPALRALLGQQPAAGSRRRSTKRAWPPRGLAACFTSTNSRPPCIRWTMNVIGSKRARRYLPRRPTPSERAAVRLVRRRYDRLQRGERERHELRQVPTGVVGSQPLGVGLDFGQLGHGGSAVLGPRPNVGEHRIEGAEHGLRCEQPLLVTEQADVAVDEGILRVELARWRRPRRCPTTAPCGRARVRRGLARSARRRRRPGGGR